MLTLQANVSNTHGINSSCEPKYTDTDCPTASAASSNLRNFSSCVIVSPPNFSKSTSTCDANTLTEFFSYCILNL